MPHMPRQNWRAPTTNARIPLPPSCTPFFLSAGLTLSLESTTTVLTAEVAATPACYTSQATPTTPHDDGFSVSTADLRDPFYASTIPMAYSIAATSTLAYVLLLLLFLPNPPHERPWLQKVATLAVCICLTIAFAETTDVLRHEYSLVGSSIYSLTNEAREVRSRVVAGIHLKVGRIISDLFLWLAQVQTLIRLFPRQREKVVIKWAGFALILLDTLFSVLQAFVSPMASTDSFLDAIPALSYLFQICCSTLYAGCVIYYSIAKRRYSYMYPHRLFSPPSPGTKKYGGRSIFLVAILSIASILTPLVFFIVDIAQKDLAGWGDYIRWVGAAASSVVVWEWVDRIEGLEREENKGGVLGREVYDEDEDLRFIGGRGGGGTSPPAPPPPPPRRRNSRHAPTTTAASDSTRYEVNVRQLTSTDRSSSPSEISATTNNLSGYSSPSTLPPSDPPINPTPSAPPPTVTASRNWRLPRKDVFSRAIERTTARLRATRPSAPPRPPPALPVTIIPPPKRRRTQGELGGQPEGEFWRGVPWTPGAEIAPAPAPHAPQPPPGSAVVIPAPLRRPRAADGAGG